MKEVFQAMRKHKQDQKQENAKLRECVEFYAEPQNYNMDSSFIKNDEQLISYINESQWEVGSLTKYPMQDYVGGKKAR